jgi:hypothetical protein
MLRIPVFWFLQLVVQLQVVEALNEVLPSIPRIEESCRNVTNGRITYRIVEAVLGW